jgi:hypothetical protein
VAFEGGDVVGDDSDEGDAAEDTDEGPEDDADVTPVGALLDAVAEEAGDGEGKMPPWWRRDEGVEVAVDVEAPVPRVAAGGPCCCRHGGERGRRGTPRGTPREKVPGVDPGRRRGDAPGPGVEER